MADTQVFRIDSVGAAILNSFAPCTCGKCGPEDPVTLEEIADEIADGCDADEVIVDMRVLENGILALVRDGLLKPLQGVEDITFQLTKDGELAAFILRHADEKVRVQ